MSKHLWGLDALQRVHLEHVREFKLSLELRNADLTITTDDETNVSFDLSGGFGDAIRYRIALEAIVTAHTLWSGQSFKFFPEEMHNGRLVWRRV